MFLRYFEFPTTYWYNYSTSLLKRLIKETKQKAKTIMFIIWKIRAILMPLNDIKEQSISCPMPEWQYYEFEFVMKESMSSSSHVSQRTCAEGRNVDLIEFQMLCVIFCINVPRYIKVMVVRNRRTRPTTLA